MMTLGAIDRERSYDTPVLQSCQGCGVIGKPRFNSNVTIGLTQMAYLVPEYDYNANNTIPSP